MWTFVFMPFLYAFFTLHLTHYTLLFFSTFAANLKIERNGTSMRYCRIAKCGQINTFQLFVER